MSSSDFNKAEDLAKKAEKVFIYGFSLVVTELTHRGSDDRGFDHLRKFPDSSEERVVKLNRDTLYSFGFTQLKNSPYFVHIPEIKDRYYLFPVMDAYTNVVQSIGTRTPEKSSGDYLLLLEGQEAPKEYSDARKLYFKDSLNSILLRIETRGEKDYEYVNRLQDEFVFKPVYPEKIESVPKASGSPASVVSQMDAEAFFTLLADLIRYNPVRDQVIHDYAVELGLYSFDRNPGNFWSSLPEDVHKALSAGLERGFVLINDDRIKREVLVQNQWFAKLKDIGVYNDNYLARASTALKGWGANIPEDSFYNSAYSDINGNPFSSSEKYKIHFEKDGFPHAAVFWSLTLYGLPDNYLAENIINRFVINTYDVQDGKVELSPDGSLDIFISRNEPEDPHEKKNWLPAPEFRDSFSLALRNYYPDEFTLEGKWMPPVVTRL